MPAPALCGRRQPEPLSPASASGATSRRGPSTQPTLSVQAWKSGRGQAPRERLRLSVWGPESATGDPCSPQASFQALSPRHPCPAAGESTVDSGVLATSAVFPGKVDGSTAPGPEPNGSGRPGWDELLALLLAAALGASLEACTLLQGSPCACSLARGLFVGISAGFLEVVFHVKGSQAGWRFPHLRDKSQGPHAYVNKPQALNPSKKKALEMNKNDSNEKVGRQTAFQQLHCSAQKVAQHQILASLCC